MKRVPRLESPPHNPIVFEKDALPGIEVEGNSNTQNKIQDVAVMETEKGVEVPEAPFLATNGVQAPMLSVEVVERSKMDVDIVEEPHVQLRILESETSDLKKEIHSLLAEFEAKNKAPENHLIKESSTAEPSTKRKLQFGERTSVEATSDDDPLVIDLSEDDAVCAEEKPMEQAASDDNVASSESKTEPQVKIPEFPPMKKFPGLIPLFGASLFGVEEEAKLTLRRKSLGDQRLPMGSSSSSPPRPQSGPQLTDIDETTQLKTADEGTPRVPQDLGSLNNPREGLRHRGVSSTVCRPLEVLPNVSKPYEKNGFFYQRDGLSSNPLCAVNSVPKHSSNQKSKDMKGPLGLDKVCKNSTLNAQNKLTQCFPEEIVIEDSDDELMEVSAPERSINESASLVDSVNMGKSALIES